MSSTATRYRHPRLRPAATFERAHAPLRRSWQGPQRSTWEPRLAQLDHLHPDDLPPVSVQRGVYYAPPAPVSDVSPTWRRLLALTIAASVDALLLWGIR